MFIALLDLIRQIDFALLSDAVAFTNSSRFAYNLVYFAAEYAIVLLPLLLLYLWKKREVKSRHLGSRKAVMLAVMSLVATLALKSLSVFVYLRVRPFITHPELLWIGFKVDENSFPSGHAMFAFAVAVSLCLSGYRRIGALAVLIAITVGLGRVFAGVHYPTDVLAGVLIGSACAWYFHREASSLKRYLPDE
ncbi:MAG: phosphatidic acid phosphatase [Patescibacteria group bacterium]|jgi:undecaprenyl-diphosphatase|nr:phosphatidic acid phosphatase [Patescibacteria group bacterium]